jgi:hypothetical protein
VAGRGKRKRRKPAAASRAPTGAGASAGEREDGPSKDDVARERLEPLREDERPLAVTIGAVLAALLGLANVIGVIFAGSRAAAAIPFAILMGVTAAGMWNARYWAVLGFQVLLAITAVYSGLFLLLRASKPASVGASAVALAVSGTLFWFLVKSLARIQMPARRRPG